MARTPEQPPMPRPDPRGTSTGGIVDLDAIGIHVTQLEAGNRDAWGQFFRRYSPDVTRRAAYRVGNRPTNEEKHDVAGETWSAVVANAYEGRYASLDHMIGSLMTIVSHKGVDQIRRSVRLKETIASQLGDETEQEGQAENSFSKLLNNYLNRDRETDVDAGVETSRKLMLVRTLLRDVPDRQREVLWLAVVEGRAHEDIASIVGSTAGATRVTLHRALNRARSNLFAIVAAEAEASGISVDQLLEHFPELAGKKNTPRKEELPESGEVLPEQAPKEPQGDDSREVRGIRRRIRSQVLDLVEQHAGAETQPDETRTTVRINHRQRQRRAYDLHERGGSVEDIAAEMGIVPQMVETYITMEEREIALAQEQDSREAALMRDVPMPDLDEVIAAGGTGSSGELPTVAELIDAVAEAATKVPEAIAEITEEEQRRREEQMSTGTKSSRAYWMREYGRKPKEIAEALGATVPTIYSYLYLERTRRAEEAAPSSEPQTPEEQITTGTKASRAFYMRYHGMEPEVIAETLGISVITVGVYISNESKRPGKRNLELPELVREKKSPAKKVDPPSEPKTQEELMATGPLYMRAWYMRQNGMTPDEIAGALDRKVQTIYTYISHAKSRLGPDAGELPTLGRAAGEPTVASPINTESLTDEQRDHIMTGRGTSRAYWMRFYGYSVDQVAATLGITVATAKQYIYMESSRLKSEAGDQGPASGDEKPEKASRAHPAQPHELTEAEQAEERMRGRRALAEREQRLASLTAVEKRLIRARDSGVSMTDLVDEFGFESVRDVRLALTAASEKLVMPLEELATSMPQQPAAEAIVGDEQDTLDAGLQLDVPDDSAEGYVLEAGQEVTPRPRSDEITYKRRGIDDID